jgi:hypothetical protein
MIEALLGVEREALSISCRFRRGRMDVRNVWDVASK